jgi:hypothetical protein
VDLTPDVDYRGMLAELPSEDHTNPDALGEWLSWAWADAYRSRVAICELVEFDYAARFLFDEASAAGAPQADRTIAAWGLSQSRQRPRDVAYQQDYPSPRGHAEEPLASSTSTGMLLDLPG